MKLARLFLAAVAASTLAACTADSLTAPTAPPSRNDAETTECTETVAEDGSTIFVCRPSMGSGG